MLKDVWLLAVLCAPEPEISHQHFQIGSDVHIPAHGWGSALIKYQLWKSSQLE